MRVGKGTKVYRPEKSNIGDCEIGRDCVIHSHVWFADGIKIGNRVRIQAFAYIPKGVTIEDDVFIGPRATFLNDLYPPSWGKHWKETRICRGASIGASVTVLPGVTIGEESLIGAGSLVTKDVPCGEIWAGSPAKFFRKKSSLLQRAE